MVRRKRKCTDAKKCTGIYRRFNEDVHKFSTDGRGSSVVVQLAQPIHDPNLCACACACVFACACACACVCVRVRVCVCVCVCVCVNPCTHSLLFLSLSLSYPSPTLFAPLSLSVSHGKQTSISLPPRDSIMARACSSSLLSSLICSQSHAHVSSNQPTKQTASRYCAQPNQDTCAHVHRHAPCTQRILFFSCNPDNASSSQHLSCAASKCSATVGRVACCVV